MRTIMNIFLLIQTASHQKSMPMEMNNHFWYATGIIVAVLLLIYLIIALVKPEKF